MSLLRICIGLHLLALSLWLGHMFVWSLIVGPALKRVQPQERADLLRERSMFRGGFGWPSLAVLVPTGLYMLSLRGITVGDLFTGAAFHGTQGTVLAIKLGCVLAMIGYQTVFGHRAAPRAIYLNMLLALTIVGASVVLVRGWI
jgi:uncharacterized membrane protein